MKQIFRPVGKWSDRFLAAVYDPLHQIVPYHEIGGGSVLINEKHPASAFDSLDDSGCLGGTAAGILCGKASGILFVWKIIDEHGNVNIPDASSVLSPKL